MVITFPRWAIMPVLKFDFGEKQQIQFGHGFMVKVLSEIVQ